MNFPSTTRAFQQPPPSIHINPHMIQTNNQQPLPIITRPISNSPTHHFPISNSTNFTTDLRHSSSTQQVQQFQQTRNSRQFMNQPMKPESVSRMQ